MRSTLLAILLSACSVSAPSTRPELDASLNEAVVFVPRRYPDRQVELETTWYRPKTPPPWPVFVIGHGSNGKLKSHHLQSRERPAELARFFLARGYLVIAPMRQGFSHSTGESRFDCDHADYALRYAGDLQAAIDSFVEQGLAKPDQVVVAGQSNGGMVALGYAADHPRARGIINLSGGIDTDGTWCDWRSGMLDAAKRLGAQTKIPALWLYAEDDTIFAPRIAQPFFAAYRDAGAPAELILYPSGGHGFAHKKGSSAVWGADVDRFLARLGLPSEPIVLLP